MASFFAAGGVARRARFLWLLAPAALLLVPFFIWPAFIIIRESLTGPSGMMAEYHEVFANPSLRGVLVYTFYVSGVVTAFTLIVGYPIAYTISHMPKNLATAALALVFLPFWVSTVIRTFAWMLLLGRNGPVNGFLQSLGLTDAPIRFLDNGVGMIIAMIYIQIPFMVIPLYNNMKTIDPSLTRAAAALGANPARQFLKVYLPLSMPGAMVGSILVFISSLGFFVTPSLLGGSRTMLSILITQQASRLLNWPLASALATVALLITLILFAAYLLLEAAAGRRRKGGKL